MKLVLIGVNEGLKGEFKMKLIMKEFNNVVVVVVVVVLLMIVDIEWGWFNWDWVGDVWVWVNGIDLN